MLEFANALELDNLEQGVSFASNGERDTSPLSKFVNETIERISQIVDLEYINVEF